MTPYYNQIQIEPITDDGFLVVEDNHPEKGRVIAVGSKVKFVKVGDILYFNYWGLRRTKRDENDKQYFLVEDDPKFILGKESKNERKK